MKYATLCITLVIINIVAWIIVNNKTPKEIVKTEVQIKEVVKYVYKEKDIETDRVIRKKYRSGTNIVITERIRDKSGVVSESKEDKKISVREVSNSSIPMYTISCMVPIITEASAPRNLQIVAGVRLGSFPIFINAGTNVKLNSYTLGATLEF